MSMNHSKKHLRVRQHKSRRAIPHWNSWNTKKSVKTRELKEGLRSSLQICLCSWVQRKWYCNWTSNWEGGKKGWEGGWDSWEEPPDEWGSLVCFSPKWEGMRLWIRMYLCFKSKMHKNCKSLTIFYESLRSLALKKLSCYMIILYPLFFLCLNFPYWF